MSHVVTQNVGAEAAVLSKDARAHVGIAGYTSWSRAVAEQCCLLPDAGFTVSGLYIVDYTEHCFVVMGNIDRVCLSALSFLGRYHPSLRCGPGIIFRNTKRSAVAKIILIMEQT